MRKFVSLFLLLSLLSVSTPGLASCLIDRVSSIVEKIKESSAELKNYLAVSPHDIVNSIKLFSYKKRTEYFVALSRFKRFDSKVLDEHIFNTLKKAIDEKVLDLEDAFNIVKDLSRENLTLIIKESDHVLGRRFRFLTSEGKNTAELVALIADSNKIGRDVEEEILKIFNKQILSPDDLFLISEELKLQQGLKPNLSELENYMEYLSTLKKEDRKPGIMAINEVMNPRIATSKVVEKYYKYELSVDKFERNLIKKNGVKRLEDLEPLLAQTIKEKTNLYRSLTYACRSPLKNKFNSDTAKSFVNLTVGLKMGLRIYSYLHANADKPWDEAKWKGLGWEVVMNLIMSRVITKLMVGNESSVTKLVKSYLFYRVGDVVLYKDTLVKGGLYGLVVGKKDILLNEDIKAMLADPEKRKQLEDVVSFIDQNKIPENLIEKYKQFDWAKVKPDQFPVEVLDKVKKENMSQDDYDATIELLKIGLVSKLHQHKEKVGSRIAEFNMVYGIFGGIENIFASMLTLHVMCMNYDSPYKRYGLTMALTLLDSKVTNDIYYHYRKEYSGE